MSQVASWHDGRILFDLAEEVVGLGNHVGWTSCNKCMRPRLVRHELAGRRLLQDVARVV